MPFRMFCVVVTVSSMLCIVGEAKARDKVEIILGADINDLAYLKSGLEKKKIIATFTVGRIPADCLQLKIPGNPIYAYNQDHVSDGEIPSEIEDLLKGERTLIGELTCEAALN